MTGGTPRTAPAPRPGYEALRRYGAGDVRPFTLDLSDNTNLWGMPPAAADALSRLATGEMTRYPSLYGGRLKQAIAELHTVPPEMVVTGHGSDGIIDPAIRAFAREGGALAYPDPTFVMVRPFAVANGMVPRPVPLRDDYYVDVDALIGTGAEVIYVCTPNNPTGRSVDPEALERIAARAPGLVIIDEAYAEFAGRDAVALARSSDRVLVTRTFSKAYGLAGLRVGYGIAAPSVVEAIEKARGPYAVNVTGEVAAAAVIESGRDWVEAHVADAVVSRRKLHEALREIGLDPVISDANFLFVPVPGALAIAGALAGRGIAVRAFGGLREVSPALRRSAGAALRITVAPWNQLVVLVTELAAVLGREAGA